MLFIVLVLLTSNIILAFMLTGYNTDKKASRKKMDEKVSAWYAEVGLEQKQIDTFKLLKEEYFRVMKPLWNEIRDLKDSLYTHLEKNPEDSLINHYLVQISNKNMVADKNTFTHFSRLRTMCTPEQQIKFDTIIPKMVNRPWSRPKK